MVPSGITLQQYNTKCIKNSPLDQLRCIFDHRSSEAAEDKGPKLNTIHIKCTSTLPKSCKWYYTGCQLVTVSPPYSLMGKRQSVKSSLFQHQDWLDHNTTKNCCTAYLKDHPWTSSWPLGLLKLVTKNVYKTIICNSKVKACNSKQSQLMHWFSVSHGLTTFLSDG